MPPLRLDDRSLAEYVIASGLLSDGRPEDDARRALEHGFRLPLS